MEIYRIVQCSDRLPDKEGTYITNEGERTFMPHYLDGWFWGDNNKNITYWLEPIEVTINSEKILSKEERKQALLCHDNNRLAEIFRYFKLLYDALEASDLQVVELRQRLIDTKALHREYREQTELELSNYRISPEEFNKLYDKTKKIYSEYQSLLTSADERYNEAYQYVEIQCCAGLVCIDLDTVNEALKIAAYGNNK